MPNGRVVEMDASGRVLMSRATQRMIGGGLAIAGLLTLVLPWFAWRSDQEFRAALLREQSFVQATCDVVSASLGHANDDGSRELTLAYDVPANGRTYRATRYRLRGNHLDGYLRPDQIEKDLTSGRPVPCWYDPAQPSNAVLMRSSVPEGQEGGIGLTLGISLFGALLAALGVWGILTKARWAVGNTED